jgi:hypothetical protein
MTSTAHRQPQSMRNAPIIGSPLLLNQSHTNSSLIRQVARRNLPSSGFPSSNSTPNGSGSSSAHVAPTGPVEQPFNPDDFDSDEDGGYGRDQVLNEVPPAKGRTPSVIGDVDGRGDGGGNDSDEDDGKSGDEWAKEVERVKKLPSSEDYEKERQANIARNAEMLKSMGLGSLGASWGKKTRGPRKSKEKGVEATRRSGRQPKGSL